MDQSAECEAFRHAYAHIFSQISECDPYLSIANLLYSSGVLDRTTRDAVTDPRKQRVSQIRCLLAHLEKLIQTTPATYQQLMGLLEKEEMCWFNQIGNLLQDSFGR